MIKFVLAHHFCFTSRGVNRTSLKNEVFLHIFTQILPHHRFVTKHRTSFAFAISGSCPTDIYGHLRT